MLPPGLSLCEYDVCGTLNLAGAADAVVVPTAAADAELRRVLKSKDRKRRDKDGGEEEGDEDGESEEAEDARRKERKESKRNGGKNKGKKDHKDESESVGEVDEDEDGYDDESEAAASMTQGKESRLALKTAMAAFIDRMMPMASHVKGITEVASVTPSSVDPNEAAAVSPLLTTRTPKGNYQLFGKKASSK